ncbi:MAG: coenzyme F420-0:L-glutamate ligase / coenzyme F420:gamma-L-glutamate ligase [Solirubrobacterales bacterium]|nr:coenzyme F420-0:L-glutamate ligase / coenzyme F420:gamma-L-glutamate ligase [Solirubrobacterales bacterium]
MARLELIPVAGLPEIAAGARLGELIAAGAELEASDVVVVAQKVVSKAEGRLRRLSDVEPEERARQMAAELGKDPRMVQLILEQSARVIRAERGVLIVETVDGWRCANAGIDASNVADEGTVTLLPVDSDSSARRIRAEIGEAAGLRPAVVIADSFGRPWRLGQADVAIGCAGLVPIDDWRGRHDRAGRELEATVIAIADEIAAAADLARSKDDGVPVVVLRGLDAGVSDEDGPGAAALRRPASEDLFD